MKENLNQPEANTQAKRWFLWGIPVVLGLLITLLLTLLRPDPEPVNEVLPSLPSSLTFNNASGNLTISGLLPEHAHSERMLTTIKQVFGKDTATAELQISKQAAPAEWLLGASNFLGALPGTENLNLEITDEFVKLTGRVATDEARKLLLDRAAIQFGDKLTATVDVTPDAAALAAAKSAWHARLSEQIRFAREAEARAKAEFVSAEQQGQLSDQQQQLAALQINLESEQQSRLALETELASFRQRSLQAQAEQAKEMNEVKTAYADQATRAAQLSQLVDDYRAADAARTAEQARLKQLAQQAETARLAALAKAEAARLAALAEAERVAQLAELARQQKAKALAEAKHQAELAAARQRAMLAEQNRLNRQQAAIQSRVMAINCEQELNQVATDLPLVFMENSTAINGASYPSLGVLAQHLQRCLEPVQNNDLSIQLSTAQGKSHTLALIDYLETLYGIYPGLLRAVNHPVTQSGDNPPLVFSLSTL